MAKKYWTLAELREAIHENNSYDWEQACYGDDDGGTYAWLVRDIANGNVRRADILRVVKEVDQAVDDYLASL